MVAMKVSYSSRQKENSASRSTIMMDSEPKATLGLICLPTDLMVENNTATILGQLPDIRWRLQRLEIQGDFINTDSYLTANDTLYKAADMLRPVNSVNAIALACTSLAFTLGVESVHRQLQKSHPDAMVTDMATSSSEALRFLGAKK